MRKTIIAVILLVGFALAQPWVNPHFGEVTANVITVDTMEVDSLTHFHSDVVVDSQLTIGDTLSLGSSSPEYFFYIYNIGTYSLFRGDDDGKTYVAVDTDHATAEVGYSFWRDGTEYWTIEDSNGTFLIYDSDDTANRVSIDGSDGTVTIYQNLHVNGDVSFGDSLFVTGNVSTSGNFDDLQAVSYNFASGDEVSGDADSIVIDFSTDIPALSAGATIEFIAEASNTGNTDVYVDGGSAIDVLEASDQSELEAGDIDNGMYVVLKYDGADFQQVSQSGN